MRNTAIPPGPRSVEGVHAQMRVARRLGAIPVPHNTEMAATLRRISTAWGEWRVDGRFAVAAVGLVLAVAFVGVHPLLSTPQTQSLTQSATR